MNIKLRIYRVSRNPRLKKLRGFWRFQAWAQHLVLDKYFKLPYLEGHAWVCPAHTMGSQVFFNGVYEPVIIRIIREFIRREYSFIDVGANLGLHTLAAAFLRKAEAQYFFAFEPEKMMFSMLRKNCLSNDLPYVTCKQEAIGKNEGSCVLYVSTNHNKGGNSLIPQKGLTPGGMVKISTLDQYFFHDQFLGKPVLLKVDVEGFEEEVILGGMQWLSKIEDASVICEIGSENKDDPIKLESFVNILKSVGFERSWIIIDPQTVSKEGRFSTNTFNMLFVKGVKSNQITTYFREDYLREKGILWRDQK